VSKRVPAVVLAAAVLLAAPGALVAYHGAARIGQYMTLKDFRLFFMGK